VAVSNSGNIVRSTDNGTTWDNVTSGTNENLLGAGFANNTFVVVGGEGTILTSSDNGSNFSAVVDPGNHLTGVEFGNNTFVAVGVFGGLYRSTDNGSNWASVTSGTTGRLRGVAF
jgi:photosystem II stability/assembly factor-like uncharacterized protein